MRQAAQGELHTLYSLAEGVRSYFDSSPRFFTASLALNMLTSSIAYLLDVL
jgi:hypothetical protein